MRKTTKHDRTNDRLFEMDRRPNDGMDSPISNPRAAESVEPNLTAAPRRDRTPRIPDLDARREEPARRERSSKLFLGAIDDNRSAGSATFRKAIQHNGRCCFPLDAGRSFDLPEIRYRKRTLEHDVIPDFLDSRQRSKLVVRAALGQPHVNPVDDTAFGQIERKEERMVVTFTAITAIVLFSRQAPRTAFCRRLPTR